MGSVRTGFFLCHTTYEIFYCSETSELRDDELTADSVSPSATDSNVEQRAKSTGTKRAGLAALLADSSSDDDEDDDISNDIHAKAAKEVSIVHCAGLSPGVPILGWKSNLFLQIRTAWGGSRNQLISPT